MLRTPTPPEPSPDDQLVVRVRLTTRHGEALNVTITVQRPCTVRPSVRRRLATLAKGMAALVASAIAGALLEHLATLLTDLL